MGLGADVLGMGNARRSERRLGSSNAAWALALGLCASLLAPAAALASAGCDAVNGGTLNFAKTPGGTVNSPPVNAAFSAGEKLTLTVTNPGNAASLNTPNSLVLRLGAAAVNGNSIANGTTLSLTANGTEVFAQSGVGETAAANITIAVVCQAVAAATTTTVTSSLNPSAVGQPVTFTATVSGTGGTPTGTVNFLDGGAVIGNGALAGGVATFTTANLAQGNHSITAAYAGAGSFTASTSAALTQAVGGTADSAKLQALQAMATKVVAQNSGSAISGAVDSAISEGFGGGGPPATVSGAGVRFNFAADPDGKPDTIAHAADPFSGSLGTARSFAPEQRDRENDAFGALAYAGGYAKAPPRRVEQRDWYGWAEVRGAHLDRWGTGGLGVVTGASLLSGDQVNLLAGVTRKLTPNFLIGVLGGYETFDYRSDALQGRLKGDGWTVGSYLGWMLAPNIRFDAAFAYSGIGYDGSAGTASGQFGGQRWLLSSGLTGTYQSWGLQIEPSARIYALWEHQNAYRDTLGTLLSDRNFAIGRASGGVKLSYPVAWISTATLVPYVGVYSDYYFNSDNLTLVAAVPAIPVINVFDGWSARAIGGLAAKFNNGAQVAIGGERSGIGGSFGLWTYRARASVPFGAR
ncbi:Ig-like domain repeat protein [Bradyrhizobium sp. AUGA SZCCT0169]|nr:Ig-like domain repeat protein [Bradyrhizobium sp. AUGA SZCCT0169]